MSNLKKEQAVPFIKVEPRVKDEALVEIASEGVTIAGVEEVVSSPATIGEKKAPLKKKKALGKRASVKKKVDKEKKNVKAKKAVNKENGVVKVKRKKVVAVVQQVVVVKRKVGRPRLTAKQKSINKIIRDGLKMGDVISAKQASVVHYKIKQGARIKGIAEARFWLQSVKQMPDGVSKKMIIMMAVIAIIRGKLGMPTNVTLYKERSVAMYNVMSENPHGYYTVAFAGLAQWLTRNTALDTAIKNNEKNDGSGSATIVKACRADVKTSLNLFMTYINLLAFSNQTLAVSIIETALCVVIVRGAKTVKDFEYKMGPGTGKIRLKSAGAKIAGKRVPANYEFQYGYMVAGAIVWGTIIGQPRCKILLSAMATGVLTYFRKRVTTTAGGMSGWSAVLETSVL